MTDGQSTRRGRPRSFKPAELITAALELGHDNLALSNVADTLDVPRTTVYNHVGSPEDLGRLVLSSILGSLPSGEPPPKDGDWQTQLGAYAIQQRDTLLAAGPWLRFYDPEVHIPSETLHTADRLIGLLVEAEFSVEMAGYAITLVTSLVQESTMLRRRDQGFSEPDQSYILRLSSEDFPWIAAADVIRDSEWEENQFRYNLECALIGIAEVLQRGSKNKPPRKRRTVVRSSYRPPRS